MGFTTIPDSTTPTMLANLNDRFTQAYKDFCHSPVRQTVLAGSVDANGAASFISSAPYSITISATVPLVISFAAGFDSLGTIDYIGRVTANPSYSGSLSNGTHYIYADRNISTGALTYGDVMSAPIYGYGVTKSVSSLQHTYRIDEGVMYVGNGTTANAVQRVFLGEYVVVTGSITYATAYALHGKYVGPLQNIPAVSSMANNSHNIGTNQITMESRLVCVTTDLNYAVGDEVKISSLGDTSGTNGVFVESATGRLNLRLATSANAPWLRNAAGGASAAITAARWNLRPEATRSF